ncbi:MAG: sensor histidine kinase [Flavobacteriaceae bacterium]
MKWIVFLWTSLCTATYLGYSQSDFIKKNRSLICHQMSLDNTKLLILVDSLYQKQMDTASELERAYLNLWKAQGHFYSLEQSLDSIAFYGSIADELFKKQKDSEGLFESKRMLGKVQHYNNNFLFSQKYLNQAADFVQTEIQKFKIHIDYSDFYTHKGNIDSTLFHLYKAEQILPLLNKEHCEFRFLKSELNISLGMAEIRKTTYEDIDYDQAIKYFKRAIESGDLSVDRSIENYLFCLVNLAYCYRKGGYFGQRTHHLDSARFYTEEYIRWVEASKVSNKFGKLETAYENLGWLHYAEGKADVGMYDIQRAMSYQDSVYNKLLNNRVLEITDTYENKLKNQRIENLNTENEQIRKNLFLFRLILLMVLLLVGVLVTSYYRFRQKNRLLKKQQLEIRQVKDQLEVLLREIHHRIKNNLQVISSFLGIQKRKLKQKKVIEALNQSQARIQTIADMHEQLYAQKGLESIAMEPYFKKIVKNCSENVMETQTIDFKTEIENHALDFDRGLSLGIILNELITNAVKYAFTQNSKGTVFVFFKKIESQYLLTVKDNGKGFPPNLKHKINQQEGMGYQIIRAMISKLKGTLEIREYIGAHIDIQIPN